MTSGAPRPPVQSVGRACDLLEALAGQGGLGTIRELSTATELPVATVHRLLRTLIDCGYLVQLRDRRYGLSQKLVTLGEAAARSTTQELKVAQRVSPTGKGRQNIDDVAYCHLPTTQRGSGAVD
ncbi:helix-turn-helix domain-containing protein [Nesterenkonia haasae]|uniref:helix-turn-helix domain-containing protein n=1 Tax=Nesterenkonia haasae TaxID=2587813 RepID=UPI001390EA1F|nr:helix-turn-helix domain-containing protein [Nesterenkonia haasae]